MNQIHYAILDHKDKYFNLEETKRYIDINMIHVIYYYEKGKEKKKKVKYPVKNCVKSDFDGNDDQRKYFESEVIKKKHNFICLGEEALNLTIEGNI